MKKEKKQKKVHKTALFFTIVFIIIVSITVLNNLLFKKAIVLEVPDNPGVSGLETKGDTLVCMFQNGRIVTWDWNTYNQISNFKAASDRAVVLTSQQLAAINTTGDKLLTVYSLPAGQEQKSFSVGWSDQDVWLRISPDKNTLALIRQNPANTKGNILFEFLSVDIEKEILGSPAALSIREDTEEFEDYAVDNNGIVYAVGSKNDTGRIAAIDLTRGLTVWDTVYKNTREFCACLTAPDGSAIYGGNRDGMVYKLDTKTGHIIKTISLLEEGETRSITNDYSVLNLAFSPDGHYYVATINPKTYVLKNDSNRIIYIETPADKLISKIAFSPDNKFIATSDIRAGYPIKIWPMPEEE